jgi:hypothetical protein
MLNFGFQPQFEQGFLEPEKSTWGPLFGGLTSGLSEGIGKAGPSMLTIMLENWLKKPQTEKSPSLSPATK